MRIVYYTQNSDKATTEEVEKRMRESGFLTEKDSVWFLRSDREEMCVLPEYTTLETYEELK